MALPPLSFFSTYSHYMQSIRCPIACRAIDPAQLPLQFRLFDHPDTPLPNADIGPSGLPRTRGRSTRTRSAFSRQTFSLKVVDRTRRLADTIEHYHRSAAIDAQHNLQPTRPPHVWSLRCHHVQFLPAFRNSTAESPELPRHHLGRMWRYKAGYRPQADALGLLDRQAPLRSQDALKETRSPRLEWARDYRADHRAVAS